MSATTRLLRRSALLCLLLVPFAAGGCGSLPGEPSGMSSVTLPGGGDDIEARNDLHGKGDCIPVPRRADIPAYNHCLR